MARLVNLWRQEPALIVAFASAVVAALAMPEAWARVVMAAVAIAGGLVTRSQVWSPASVDQLGEVGSLKVGRDGEGGVAGQGDREDRAGRQRPGDRPGGDHERAR